MAARSVKWVAIWRKRMEEGAYGRTDPEIQAYFGLDEYDLIRWRKSGPVKTVVILAERLLARPAAVATETVAPSEPAPRRPGSFAEAEADVRLALEVFTGFDPKIAAAALELLDGGAPDRQRATVWPICRRGTDDTPSETEMKNWALPWVLQAVRWWGAVHLRSGKNKIEFLKAVVDAFRQTPDGSADALAAWVATQEKNVPGAAGVGGAPAAHAVRPVFPISNPHMVQYPPPNADGETWKAWAVAMAERTKAVGPPVAAKLVAEMTEAFLMEMGCPAERAQSVAEYYRGLAARSAKGGAP